MHLSWQAADTDDVVSVVSLLLPACVRYAATGQVNWSLMRCDHPHADGLPSISLRSLLAVVVHDMQVPGAQAATYAIIALA